jgi:hypothetical protein
MSGGLQQQGGLALTGRNRQSPLDGGMLECLAVIAAANDRSVEEELNLAVRSYVLNQFAEQGESRLLERAFAEPSATASK